MCYSESHPACTCCDNDGLRCSLPGCPYPLPDTAIGRALNDVRSEITSGRRVIYLSGPMRGLPDWNYPAFHGAAARLRARGCAVYSPAEFHKGDPEDFPMREAFAEFCAFICGEADTIVLLPGWEASLGVSAELALARNCGLDVLTWPDMAPLSDEPAPVAVERSAPPIDAGAWRNIGSAIYEEVGDGRLRLVAQASDGQGSVAAHIVQVHNAAMGDRKAIAAELAAGMSLAPEDALAPDAVTTAAEDLERVAWLPADQLAYLRNPVKDRQATVTNYCDEVGTEPLYATLARAASTDAADLDTDRLREDRDERRRLDAE